MILFERGEFTQNDTYNTASLLFYYTFGILGESLRLFIVRLYFSKNNTSKDGFYSICKECRNKKNKEDKAKNKPNNTKYS